MMEWMISRSETPNLLPKLTLSCNGGILYATADENGFTTIHPDTARRSKIKSKQSLDHELQITNATGIIPDIILAILDDANVLKEQLYPGFRRMLELRTDLKKCLGTEHNLKNASQTWVGVRFGDAMFSCMVTGRPEQPFNYRLRDDISVRLAEVGWEYLGLLTYEKWGRGLSDGPMGIYQQLAFGLTGEDKSRVKAVLNIDYENPPSLWSRNLTWYRLRLLTNVLSVHDIYENWEKAFKLDPPFLQLTRFEPLRTLFIPPEDTPVSNFIISNPEQGNEFVGFEYSE